jgi:hypothetical protein
LEEFYVAKSLGNVGEWRWWSSEEGGGVARVEVGLATVKGVVSREAVGLATV